MKFFLLFLLLLNNLCANEVPPPSSIEAYQEEKNLDQLLLLIQKRLVIMHEVARTKWHLNLPIEDKNQEALLLDQLALKSESLGLDKNRIRLFFEAQIEAAKMIQKQDFAIWQRENTPKFNTILDLKTSLRPYIDSINQEMLEILARGVHGLLCESPLSKRASDAIDTTIWKQATLPLNDSF